MSTNMARSPIFSSSSRPVTQDTPLDSLFGEEAEQVTSPPPASEDGQDFDLEHDDLSDEDFDASLGAIQERISVANYLQLLLVSPLFGDDDSPAAQLVLARVRTLVRREAEIVLGIRSERERIAAAESPFNEDEIRALKLIASRALTPREPAVTPVTPQPLPPPKVTTPPKARVVPVSGSGAKPQPKPFRAKGTPSPTPQPPKPPQGLQKVGGVVTEGGRMKRTLEFPDQNVKIVQDLTPQQVPTNRVPMPQGAQMSVLTEMQAQETVAAQGQSATLSRLAALKS